MVKQQLPWSKKATGIRTPSLYGSHKSMIRFLLAKGFHVSDWSWPPGSPSGNRSVLTWKLAAHGWVVLEDAEGLYITRVRRLDTGLADPHRYGHADRDAFFTETLREYDLDRKSLLALIAASDECFVWVDGVIQKKPDDSA